MTENNITRLIPKPFYISAFPKKRENPKLFRPKELREYIFPELGMIMYPLFWIKYTLYLIKNGYDPSNQDYLFFWVKKNGKIDPSKGVLYYSLLSRYYSTKKQTEDVSVGKLWAKGRLFKQDWKSRILKGLRKFVKDPNRFDFTNFVETTFSADFKTDCARAKIDLPKHLTKMRDLFNKKSRKHSIESMKLAIESFTIALADVLIRDGINCKKGSVIHPNIVFTRRVLLQNNTELGALEKLANTNFSFTKEEIEILLNQLQSTEKGRYFLRSLLLISYFDPRYHDNDYIRNRMRKIYDIFTSIDDFQKRIERKFSGFKFLPSILRKLEETCFYWELNFFLTDGETIARTITSNAQGVIRKKDVQEYFSQTQEEEPKYFVEFIKNLKNDEKRRKCFLSLIKNISKQRENKIAGFLLELLDGVKKGEAGYEIFLNLLVFQGTLERETENLYSIIGKPKEDFSYALFYGINPLIDWTRTILKRLGNV